MDLDHWRARIDEVDARLLQLINERLEYAVEIGKIKQAEENLEAKKEKNIK